MPRDELNTTRDTPAAGDRARSRAADAGDELVGNCLDGNFVLRALVGRGASGRVYRADQVALDRIVAVKVFGPVAQRDEAMARRFHDEAYAASRLRHPNVVSIYDFGETADGLLYIAMEFLSGRTLRQLLHEQFPLSIDRVIDLMVQILDALEEAHASGVIHADLKADNIIVEPRRTGGELVKVIDFGISRIAPATAPTIDGDAFADADAARAPEDTGSRRRIATLVTGTPEYMAPEVIGGEAPTKATDIYAAGVVLYELVTGVLPFTGESVPVILARHLQDELEPLAVRFPELSIPRALERVVRRALAKQPGDRFANVAEFRDAVRSARVDTSASALCEICGARYGAQFKFCSECGVRLAVEANSGDRARREVVAEKRAGERAFERGDASAAIKSLRDAVGMAIRLGDVGLIADCYHALAHALSEAGAVDAAMLELEEALTLVTASAPSAKAGGVAGDSAQRSGGDAASPWQLLVLLGELYYRRNRDREALQTASRALAAARQVSSTRGRQAAEKLMAKLYARARQARRGRRRDTNESPDRGPPSLADIDNAAMEVLRLDEDTQPFAMLPELGPDEDD